MPHFLYKLIPPRPTFPGEMSEGEAAIMQEHFGYWSKLISERQVVAYGPVMDPKGTYGVGILEVDDDETAARIAENDPAIRSNADFDFELHPMPDTIARE
jgi:uncharacterized protein YciI